MIIPLGAHEARSHSRAACVEFLPRGTKTRTTIYSGNLVLWTYSPSPRLFGSVPYGEASFFCDPVANEWQMNPNCTQIRHFFLIKWKSVIFLRRPGCSVVEHLARYILRIPGRPQRGFGFNTRVLDFRISFLACGPVSWWSHVKSSHVYQLHSKTENLEIKIN